MAHDSNGSKPRNLLLITFLITVTLFTAFHEGYLPLISPLFWIFLATGYCICIWLSLSISTRRLLALMFGIFVLEYVKETIGLRSGLWTYHGSEGLYNFGVWAWVLAGLVAYAISTKGIIRQVRKLRISPPRWLNPIIVILLSSLILLTLGDYWGGVGALFFLFYALLLIVVIYASMRMDFPVFVGIVITAWMISNPSEYAGSISSGAWTFPHDPYYPPFFLLFGCWPLEILAQYSLSAFLANEPLDKDTFSYT
jgi:hypothetical protein